MSKRNMPSFVHANHGDSGRAAELPTIKRGEWFRAAKTIFKSMAGREATDTEMDEIDDCARHGWTLRPTVEHVLGRDLTADEWESARAFI